ncbi:hypothetical protein [Glycomyces sp. NPDC047010]|uniref:hypothetical protein n=1 Tax=Glycomyces sp. NPDC047010 TaxID=3155023 RepID=UPI0033DFB214
MSTTDHTVPDQDPAVLLDAFYDRLAGALRDLPDPDTLLDWIRVRARRLAAAEQGRVPDGPARDDLRMTVALVAAYEALAPELGAEAAIAAVRDALAAAA